MKEIKKSAFLKKSKQEVHLSQQNLCFEIICITQKKDLNVAYQNLTGNSRHKYHDQKKNGNNPTKFEFQNRIHKNGKKME